MNEEKPNNTPYFVAFRKSTTIGEMTVENLEVEAGGATALDALMLLQNAFDMAKRKEKKE